MRLGIICPSEIAYRRFLPALNTIDEIEFAGVAVNTPKERYGEKLPNSYVVENMLNRGKQKAYRMIEDFGGKVYQSFEKIICDSKIDAIYLPLPPALHYKWALKAIENGKHILVEKPVTTHYRLTKDLVGMAIKKRVAIHENYMFTFHNQMRAIKEIIDCGELGDIRIVRVNFGFPRRAANDFRYSKKMGGGALLDAGGYTIKCASEFLGETVDVSYAKLNYIDEFEVDVYGSGALVDSQGRTVQIAFGMDNEYRCELEVWGSDGLLITERILTAPAGLVPTAKIRKGSEEKNVELPVDDAFQKSIIHFAECIKENNTREENYKTILKQADLLEKFIQKANV